VATLILQTGFVRMSWRIFVCSFAGSFCILSPSFSLYLYLTIFFVPRLIHDNCSLDELQVNYNNDRSRWFNRFFLLNVIYLLTPYSSLLSLFLISAGTLPTQICLRIRKAGLHRYVYNHSMNQIFLLIFVNSVLIIFSSSMV